MAKSKFKALTKARTFDAVEMFSLRSSEVETEALQGFIEARQANLARAMECAIKSVAETAFREGVAWALTHPLTAAERKDLVAT